MNPRICVIGSGYWGKNLVRNFETLGCLQAVCDADLQGRTVAQALAPKAAIFADPSEVWRRDDITAVVIATPAVTHATLCEQALKAGKDVLCEKPLALDYHEAVKLNTIAKAQQKILMVGHLLEYHPAVRKLQELVAENYLGRVRYIYSNRLNLGKIRREENILWSFAPHDIAVILRLMGTLPFQVVAAGGTYITPNVADVTVTQLLFDNGVAAHIFVSWLNPFKEQRIVVVGSERMAVFDDIAKQLTVYDQRVDVKQGDPVPVKGEGTLIPFDAAEPLKLECEAFLTAITRRESPLTDGDSALRVLKVVAAGQRSLITHGHPVQLPME